MLRAVPALLLCLNLLSMPSSAEAQFDQIGEALKKLGENAASVSPAAYEPTPIGRPVKCPEWVTSACWIDDATCVIGSFDELRFLSRDGKLLKTLALDAGPVKSLRYSPANSRLYAGCHQKILVIDPAERKIVSTLKGHRGEVNDLALVPDTLQLVSVSNDQTLRFWDLSEHKLLETIDGFKSPLYSVDVSPDGQLLALAMGDEAILSDPGPVQLWSRETRQLVADLAPHKKMATRVRFTPDGTKLLSSSVDERVHVYDVAKREPIGFFAGHARPVNDLIILPDSDTVISASGGNFKKLHEVKFWKISAGEAFGSFEPHGDAVVTLALSPDRKTLVTGSQDKTAQLFDVSSLEKK